MTEQNSDAPRIYGFPPEDLDWKRLPNVDTDFIKIEDLDAFARALQTPDLLQSSSAATLSREDSGRRSPTPSTAPNGDWKHGHRSASMQEADDEAARTAAVAASAAAAAGSFVPPPPIGSDYSGHNSKNNNNDHGTKAGASLSSALTTDGRPSRDMFFTARHDWAPVNIKIPKPSRRSSNNQKRRRQAGRAAASLLGQRSKDETREGYLYAVLKWPLLVLCLAWLGCLATGYALTRSYVFLYEYFFTWRGRRKQLRRNMLQASNYDDWVAAAKELDGYLGRQAWKQDKDFAYYDSRTVKSVLGQMRRVRRRLQAAEAGDNGGGGDGGVDSSDAAKAAVEELRVLLEACVKSNFVGIESARLYSQTYYGTKDLVQGFIDEREFD